MFMNYEIQKLPTSKFPPQLLEIPEPPKELSAQDFIGLMAVDKKNVDGDIRLILLNEIGRASLPMSVEQAVLHETLNEYGREY